ncbi:MAG: 16S rRNA (cytidine(1402)-2'-O)-methyltransferase [Muribaculaceae bacterium]|nr:16S rRNA (cytidine(1402)-2'-O)-methyltransferase [Muribaculaceae bacterium]
MPGKLFIVPTPVGNLGDFTPRAAEVLQNVDLILAEDTRTSGNLLRHFKISTPTSSFHKFNEHEIVNSILRRIENGETMALISDAGTPGISDPGFLLARECRKAGIEVETLPGPTAFVPALVNSGLPCDRFFFEGFLPTKKGRATRLEFLSKLPVTFIIYESPLRLIKTLEDITAVCGLTRPASVSREISKLHETVVNGTLAELIEFFKAHTPKGEIVLVVGTSQENSNEKKVHKNKYREKQEEL